MGKQIPKTLVISSSVCDVIIRLHKVPVQTEDENIIKQELSIGGCGYNVACILNHFHTPYTLFSPIGTGIYGDFIKKHFLKNNIPIFIETSQKNGCCYCLVDDSGERTFICEHGAEYFYQKEWFEQLNVNDYQQVYVCGLEIEETTGDIIIDFLKQHQSLNIYFAPGPRINKIDSQKLKRLFKLHPILHMNESEILSFTNTTSLTIALQMVYQLTHQSIIVTRGHLGCCYYDGIQEMNIPGEKVCVVDTIGAGDSHIGTIIADRAMGKSWLLTLKEANHIAAQVVTKSGSGI